MRAIILPIPLFPFESFLESRGCGGRKPIFQKWFPSPAYYIIKLNQAGINEAILLGEVVGAEAIPDATLLIEGGGADRQELATDEVVRTEEITEVIYDSQLNGVLANGEILGEVDIVGCPHRGANVLAVNLYTQSIKSVLYEGKLVIGAIQGKLLGNTKLACKERISVLLKVLKLDLIGRLNHSKLTVEEVSVVFDRLKYAVCLNCKVAYEVHSLDLHIIRKLVLFRLKLLALFNVLINLFGLSNERDKLDYVFANLCILLDVKHTEGGIAEESAIGLVDLHTVYLNGKDLGSFNCDEELVGNILKILNAQRTFTGRFSSVVLGTMLST